ncbi:hypothetical protein CTI12_AA480450 [Artemisia annua]|uniref:SWIM-type domain-containing protein n=1 Tax=Artemisia annua TaxID=35608 RepID=A0A2U1LLB9_ARTAN|nr:hypothetical protein CTI12_AA480450 [Artemisia annua]
MSNTAEKFDAKVSVRSKMHYLVKIKAKLAAHPNRDIMFRNSVFGPWLDTPHSPNDNHLLNYVLQHQVFIPESVKAKELWAVIMDEKRWVALDDEDAVRVCLLAVCELVLMGREEFLNVPPHLLTLAEDFFSWNAYPWGEYMWKYFYQRTVNVVPKHADMHLKLQKEKSKKQATYNLNGFVWALKIWILETFPNSNNWWSKDPNVIPRGLAWSNFRRFEKPDYDRLFVQDPYPIIDLVPTDKEMQQPWFIRSMAFLRGEDVPFIQAVLPNGVVHEKEGAPSIVGEVVQSLNKDVLTDVEPKENCVENDGVQDVVVQDVGEEHDVVQEAYQQLLGDSAEKNVVPESRKLMDAFEALFTEVVDVQPKLVPKVDKLRKMFCASLRLPVQPITVKENECDGKKHEEVNVQQNDVISETSNGVVGVANKITCDADTQPSTLTFLIDALAFANDPPSMPVFDCAGPDNLLQANEFCGEQSYVVSEEAKDCYERDPASVAVPANGNQNMCAATDMSAEKTRVNQTMDCASLEANTSELIGFIQKTNDLDKFIGELTNNEMMKQLMASPPPNGFKENVYGCKRRRRKPGPACVTPYQKQSDTTPLPRKRAKRATNVNKPLEAGQFPTNDRSDSPRIITTEDSDWQKLPVEPFREDLKRQKKCNPCKVTVPGYLKFLLKHGPNEEANKMYKFPWGGCDIVVNDDFWLALLGLDRKIGWLTDMLYFPLNEPRTHWVLAELQISTGTVTLYDSLAPRKRQKNLPIQENRKWWSSMREKLSRQLPLFLNESGVLQSKGISVGSYEITFNFSESVPCQAAVYGDCVFPRAFHGYCCRHLMMNFNLKSRKHKALFWKTCKAYLVSDFDSAIAEIRSFKPDAYRKLEEAGFEKWSRAYCPAKRYNYLTSNNAESINSLTKNVRKVPVTMLIEYYRELIQQWYCDRRYNGEGEPPADALTSWASAKVNDRMIKSATWVIRGIRHGKIYQVRDSRSVHTVNLTEGECSCRKWQLSGLPCGHVCAVARFSGMSNCNHWAKGWFSQTTLKRTYQQLVHPLKEPWETPGDVQVVLPPAIVKRQPGRPKENQRIRSQGEEPRIVRCSRCGVAGHYRDACREPLPSQNVRRTTTTNNEPDACEEMDYDQDDASMDDVMDYSQYTSSTAYNESSMGDMMDFSPHIPSHDYYYPQFYD